MRDILTNAYSEQPSDFTESTLLIPVDHNQILILIFILIFRNKFSFTQLALHIGVYKQLISSRVADCFVLDRKNYSYIYMLI